VYTELQLLLGAEVSAFGVSRHGRTSVEFLLQNERSKSLEVWDLLFIRALRATASVDAKKGLGCLQQLTVQRLGQPQSKFEFKMVFDTGTWVVIAEDCKLALFQQIPEARMP
jgi:hypothetical protein